MRIELLEYEKPELDVLQFRTVDIVCTSDPDNTEEDPFQTW